MANRTSPAGPRTLLVGTRRSVTELRRMLQWIEPSTPIAGCLVFPKDARTLDGGELAVLGGFDELRATLAQHSIARVLVSLPVVLGSKAGGVIRELEQSGVTWRFLPTWADQLAGRSTTPGTLAGYAPVLGSQDSAMVSRWIDPQVLLDREVAPLDEPAIRQLIENKTVLITGAGGSIGSEMARQVARFAPAKLVLAERSENALFAIDRQIAELHPGLGRAVELHDVTHAARTRTLLEKHRPAVIFHAAAHKHVPMMEEHPWDAVENNFYGTRSIADAARATGAERFVMISTDKAVKPSSIMGATKRLAELYIQHLNTLGPTRFCMVRFGNVLGSAGSVVQIWMDQVAKGGPLTITHPEMSRFFMTIREAAGLVMQSAALSGTQGRSGGELFLLDMGQSIRILDLARRFVLSQGLEPEVDIPITYTGVRPGEKLAEELAYDSEDVVPTSHPSVRTLRTATPTDDWLKETLERFDGMRAEVESLGHDPSKLTKDRVLQALRSSIPEMIEPATAAH